MTRVTPALGDLDFDKVRERIRLAVDACLKQALDRQDASPVREVAAYTVLGGGHRWRPLVAVASGLIFDSQPLDKVIPGACGVELAHAASLILDDLPSMDDARVRRGRPCPHLVFGRWAVDMAPVFMLTLAYQLSLENGLVDHQRRVETAQALSRAGLDMVAGQSRDMERGAADNDPDSLEKCYLQKSAALYAAAALTGALSVNAGSEDATRLYRCGLNLGLAYQFQDDLADVTATEAEALKTTGRDDAKTTAVDLYGLEGTRERVTVFREAALAELAVYGPEADLLRKVISLAGWQMDS